jgi:hypothetical protein
VQVAGGDPATYNSGAAGYTTGCSTFVTFSVNKPEPENNKLLLLEEEV